MNVNAFAGLSGRIDYDSLFETKVVFENKDKSGEIELGPFKTHNIVTAFFLRFFGKIYDYTDKNGKKFHINRDSFDAWFDYFSTRQEKFIPRNVSSDFIKNALESVATRSRSYKNELVRIIEFIPRDKLLSYLDDTENKLDPKNLFELKQLLQSGGHNEVLLRLLSRTGLPGGETPELQWILYKSSLDLEIRLLQIDESSQNDLIQKANSRADYYQIRDIVKNIKNKIKPDLNYCSISTLLFILETIPQDKSS